MELVHGGFEDHDFFQSAGETIVTIGFGRCDEMLFGFSGIPHLQAEISAIIAQQRRSFRS